MSPYLQGETCLSMICYKKNTFAVISFNNSVQDDQKLLLSDDKPHNPAGSPYSLFLQNSSVFGARSANIFTPWAVPNISLGVNGLLSVKLNSLSLTMRSRIRT